MSVWAKHGNNGLHAEGRVRDPWGYGKPEIQTSEPLYSPENLRSDGLGRLNSGHVKAHIEARARRADFFEPQLFMDPAWDLMLWLYAAYLDHQHVTVDQLRSYSNIPETTTLRWVRTLSDKGWVSVVGEPADSKGTNVTLSFRACVAMNGYFESLGYGAPHS